MKRNPLLFIPLVFTIMFIPALTNRYATFPDAFGDPIFMLIFSPILLLNVIEIIMILITYFKGNRELEFWLLIVYSISLFLRPPYSFLLLLPLVFVFYLYRKTYFIK